MTSSTTIWIDDMMVDRQTLKAIAELRIKAMIFDMDIDWEKGDLIQKQESKELPFWIKRWRDKEASADRTPEDYEGGEDER